MTFELVLSRFVDRRAMEWPSFAVDNGGFQALVLGPAIDPADIPALLATPSVSADGKEAATSDDVTDPKAALADLVAIAREHGMVLPRGSIVSTGTVSKPFNLLVPAAHVSARFLGQAIGFGTLAGKGNAS